MTDHQLSPVTARASGPANIRISPKLLVILFGIAVLVALVAASFVIVDPTEMAGKRRLGQVVVDRPLGPGLHFKLPLIEEIDTLQTSLETYKLDKLTVNTVDNQPITLAVGLTYRIPASAVLKLLYDVGRAGNLDIAENFQRIVADRTAKIFAQQNTTTISENRESLSTALKTSFGRPEQALRDRGCRFPDCRDHLFGELPSLGRGSGQGQERSRCRREHSQPYPL
jgi:hypothetical protein